jgi:hypothetical protein
MNDPNHGQDIGKHYRLTWNAKQARNQGSEENRSKEYVRSCTNLPSLTIFSTKQNDFKELLDDFKCLLSTELKYHRRFLDRLLDKNYKPDKNSGELGPFMPIEPTTAPKDFRETISKKFLFQGTGSLSSNNIPLAGKFTHSGMPVNPQKNKPAPQANKSAVNALKTYLESSKNQCSQHSVGDWRLKSYYGAVGPSGSAEKCLPGGSNRNSKSEMNRKWVN